MTQIVPDRSTSPVGSSVASPARRIPFDATSFLTVYIFLLYAVPSYLVIPALGSMGQLSVLWGLLGLAWWTFTKISRTRFVRSGISPVGVALMVFFGVIATTYAIGNLLGLPEHLASTADSGLIRTLSWAGVALVALDGIRSRARLVTLMHRIAWAGALMSALGLAQFFTGQSLVASISLPGFAVNDFFASTMDRGGFIRAAGTASHPLEYGTLLCVSLPLALALGMNNVRQAWYLRWLPAVVIALAVALSVSRSTLIGVVVGLLVLAPRLPLRYKIRGAFLGAVMAAGMLFLVPGLIGTIFWMFSSIGSDASSLSRTGSGSVALDIAWRGWWLGHGFGTFQPTELVLDNQFLLLFVELGLFGLASFAALALTSMLSGWRMDHHLPAGAPERIYGAALAAGVAAGSITLLFFDGLSFPITAGTLFLVYGMAGAAWEISRVDREAAGA